MKHASILTRFGRALFRECRRAFYVFVLWIIALLVGLRLQGNVALPTGIWVAGSVVTALLFALVSWLVSAAVLFTRSMAPILPLMVLQVGLAQLGLFDGLVPGRPELGGTLAWIVPLCLYVLALNLPVTRRVGRRRATYEVRCRTTLPAWLLYDGLVGRPGHEAALAEGEMIRAFEAHPDDPSRIRVIERLNRKLEIEEHRTILSQDPPRSCLYEFVHANRLDAPEANAGSVAYDIKDLGSKRQVTMCVSFNNASLATRLFEWLDDHQGKQLDRRVALLEKRVKAKGSGLESAVFA